MQTSVFVVVVTAMVGGLLGAQEEKPVPKDSVRVLVPGCSKGYMFTAAARTEDRPGVAVPEGTHLRMSGPKAMMAEIKGQEGSRIEITGLMKKGQFAQDGVRIGRGVRISPGQSPSGGGVPNPGAGQMMIDLEGWRGLGGDCPSR
jgi:hypothetical protein